MKKNDSMKIKNYLIDNLDIFGVSFNFVVEGGNTKKTIGGVVLTILYGFIFIGLFFGFGIDLYQRKRPKASFNTNIGEYKEIPLSNNNFTYAYRVEDTLGKMVLDESIIYQMVAYFKFSLVNGTWMLDFQKILNNKRCREIPNFKEKENYYNTSLKDWYCVDFDNVTLGGNYDGNFVYGIIINTYQCKNSTMQKNCASQDSIKKSFLSDQTSSNFFYSELSLEVLASMDDFENPLKTTLVNQYELLNLGLTKRKVQTFKSTKIINDVGWFLPNEKELTLASGDTILRDFTFKDNWDQDILYTKFLYFGKKVETYNRSYTKIQEIFAAMGGFAKFFYFGISLFYSAIKKIYRNLFLMNNILFDFNEEEEEGNSFMNKFKSRKISENKLNLIEEPNNTFLNRDLKDRSLHQNISTNNVENTLQIDNYLNYRKDLYNTKNTYSVDKNKHNRFLGGNSTIYNEISPSKKNNEANSRPHNNLIKDYQKLKNITFNNVNRLERKKKIFVENKNITLFDYLKYRCICRDKKYKDSLSSTKLNTYVICEKYFIDKLDILTYFNLHNQFKHFMKFFLEKKDRKLFKTIPVKFKKNYIGNKNLKGEDMILNDFKNSINSQQQVQKSDNNSKSSKRMNLLIQKNQVNEITTNIQQ